MKNFILKNKFIIFLLFMVCIIETIIFSTCFGMEEGKTVDLLLGIVNTDYLNLRTGPRKRFYFYRHTNKKSICSYLWKNWRLVYCTK